MVETHGLRLLGAAVIKQCLLDARCPHTPARREMARAWLLNQDNQDRRFWTGCAGIDDTAVVETARRALKVDTQSDTLTGGNQRTGRTLIDKFTQ